METITIKIEGSAEKYIRLDILRGIEQIVKCSEFPDIYGKDNRIQVE